MADKSKFHHRATRAAHAGGYVDPVTGGPVPPIQPSTTFTRDDEYALTDPDHIYGRDDSGLYRLAESILADLEDGADALVLPSGMAAVAALARIVPVGGALALQAGIYYGTTVWLRTYCARQSIDLIEFDATDPARLSDIMAEKAPALVFIETPSNPMLNVIDIAATTEIAHRAGALLAVDSTAATPMLTRPLDHGADIVMHSATKALNGHSDVLAGALVTSDADADWWTQMRTDRHDAGALLGRFETWLLIRGMRTLGIRVERACANAQAIAEYLSAHDQVVAVHYPGLATHPGHDIASRQMQDGFGYLMSFQVHGGAAEALAVANRLRLILRATSLGGVESLIEHRHTIEGDVSDVPANLLRLSVGIEHCDDLIADLGQALDA